MKFDEDDLGLYMDLQLKREGDWKRVKPDQAKKALITAGDKRRGPSDLEADELTGLLAQNDDGDCYE